MSKFAPFALLATFALAACAVQDSQSAVDWNRPYQPTTTPPTFQRNLAIANPPYPLPSYPDYRDEPTRFEFQPRLILPLEEDTTADQTEETDNLAFPYLDNGILYVDPNE